jgi:hypothetical protein
MRAGSSTAYFAFRKPPTGVETSVSTTSGHKEGCLGPSEASIWDVSAWSPGISLTPFKLSTYDSLAWFQFLFDIVVLSVACFP